MSETLSLEDVDGWSGVAEANAILGMDDDSQAHRRELKRILDQLHGSAGKKKAQDDQDFETFVALNEGLHWDRQLTASSNNPRADVIPVVLATGMVLYFERHELDRTLKEDRDILEAYLSRHLN